MTVSGVRAAPDVQLRLLDLQALDDELRRIDGHRRRLEAAQDIAALEGERAQLRRAAAEQRGRLEDLRTRLTRLETDVRLVVERLDRDRSRLSASSSARDVQGLEHEIAALLRRRESLEDDQLGVLEELETAESAAAATDGEGVAVDERLEAMRTDRDDALTGLAGQREDVDRRRAALAGELPPDLVALYDRQRTRYGVGAALLRGTVSQGSNVELTSADLAAIRAASPDAVILDPESSCILVRVPA